LYACFVYIYFAIYQCVTHAALPNCQLVPWHGVPPGVQLNIT
jgi:hypothetical protein